MLSPDVQHPVCVVEPVPEDRPEPRCRAKVVQGTDAGAVICGLLAIDKVHGGREPA